MIFDNLRPNQQRGILNNITDYYMMKISNEDLQPSDLQTIKIYCHFSDQQLRVQWKRYVEETEQDLRELNCGTLMEEHQILIYLINNIEQIV